MLREISNIRAGDHELVLLRGAVEPDVRFEAVHMDERVPVAVDLQIEIAVADKEGAIDGRIAGEVSGAGHVEIAGDCRCSTAEAAGDRSFAGERRGSRNRGGPTYRRAAAHRRITGQGK